MTGTTHVYAGVPGLAWTWRMGHVVCSMHRPWPSRDNPVSYVFHVDARVEHGVWHCPACGTLNADGDA